MRRRALLGMGAAALALPGGAARSQKFTDTLRVSWHDAVTTLDPYAATLRTGLALMPEIWDGLVYRDPDSLELRPLLALNWRQPDSRTLDFVLRPNVWFHNGAIFGPDDVVATVQRVRGGEALGIPTNYDWLEGAEKTGEMTVRLHLATPYPSAMAFVAMVLPILPRGEPPNAGIGTGPWRVEDFRLDRIVLARNETYWRLSPKKTAPIRRVEIAQPEDIDTPFNDLISGRCDWIWDLAPHQYEMLTQARELRALRAEGMRVQYLALDAAGRSQPGGPLTLLPVRRAIAHALDRGALSAVAAPGGSRVVDAPCYPTQFACDPVRAVDYAYDPGRARRLLAQAGLPDGFATTLVTDSRADLAEAVADALQQIGIIVTVAVMPAGDALDAAEAGQAPLFLGSWGSSSIDDMAAFLPPFFGDGALNDCGIADLAALVARAVSCTDALVQRGLYGDVIQIVTEHAAWLPLFLNAATYGISRLLQFKPAPDELPRFYRMAWR